MNLDRRTALAALAAAGLLWGTTVPVTKLALQWLPPGWLTVARFGLAAAVLLAAVRFRVRGAASPAVLAWGAVGYGGSILVQNAGITRTSVSHAALLIGATPVLVAVIAALWHRSVAPPVAWTGFAVSFAGVGLVAAGGGGGASFAGDGLVLASLGFSASFTVAQARLLPGRDPVAVTAVQFLAAALTALPVAAVTEGTPPAAAGAGPVLATAGLVLLGTLAAATLFAYGQARVSAEIAGSFVNLEPLVGVAAGAAVFGDPVGIAQAAGAAAILTGIALGSLPHRDRGGAGSAAPRAPSQWRPRWTAPSQGHAIPNDHPQPGPARPESPGSHRPRPWSPCHPAAWSTPPWPASPPPGTARCIGNAGRAWSRSRTTTTGSASRRTAVSRDVRHTRYVDRRRMLRSHSTAMIPAALRALAAEPVDDVLLVCPGVVYRRDAIDRLHAPTPHQLDLWRITRRPLAHADLREMVGLLVEALDAGPALAVGTPRPPLTPWTDARWTCAGTASGSRWPSAACDQLPPRGRWPRLGLGPHQKNVLARVVLRHLERTLTDEEANRLRDRVYAALHQGSVHQWAARSPAARRAVPFSARGGG